MNRLFVRGLFCLLLFSIATAHAVEAQDFCYPQAYRLEPTTVYERQTVRRMRPVIQTEMVEETATRYRPFEITVPVSTVETSMKEERFTVWKPVVETTYKDETYTQTEYVTETSEREEQYTTFRPVTETQVYKRQYAVQRPVTETRYYQQQYAVQRPVTETQMRTQQYTTLRPQTTIVNQTVDRGGYVPETTVTPGGVGYGLQYQRALYATWRQRRRALLHSTDRSYSFGLSPELCSATSRADVLHARDRTGPSAGHRAADANRNGHTKRPGADHANANRDGNPGRSGSNHADGSHDHGPQGPLRRAAPRHQNHDAKSSDYAAALGDRGTSSQGSGANQQDSIRNSLGSAERAIHRI